MKNVWVVGLGVLVGPESEILSFEDEHKAIVQFYKYKEESLDCAIDYINKLKNKEEQKTHVEYLRADLYKLSQYNIDSKDCTGFFARPWVKEVEVL